MTIFGDFNSSYRIMGIKISLNIRQLEFKSPNFVIEGHGLKQLRENGPDPSLRPWSLTGKLDLRPYGLKGKVLRYGHENLLNLNIQVIHCPSDPRISIFFYHLNFHSNNLNFINSMKIKK